MDEHLAEFFDELSPAELDTLIGDLSLDDAPDQKALKRLKARVRRAHPRKRRKTALRRWLLPFAAAVLAVVFLANAGLLTTAAQWTQSVLGLEASPIQGFQADGTADFQGRHIDILSHTLLVCEEAEAVSYQVELSDLSFGEPRRGHQQTAPHAYIYLYVDGQTADSGELHEGEPLVLDGGPGTCLLVVVSTVKATISGTITRSVGEVAS